MRSRRIRRLLLSSVLLTAFAGCHWGQPPKPAYIPPLGPDTREASGTQGTATGQPAATVLEPPPAGAPQVSEEKPAAEAALPALTEAATQAPAESHPAPPVAMSAAPKPEAGVAATLESPAVPPAPAETAGKPALPAAVPHNGKKPAPFVASGEPPWAQGHEELVYRVEFLGMTMGYARFTFKGKAQIDGKETYHLSVRAWTSDFLAVIYPVNETIDYYMDARTLEPLKVDYSAKAKEKADTAFYDQKKGRIVYRYKHNGEIRKEVELVPSVFDPVTVAYYFRARDLGHEERPRNVYGGRKLYQISSRLLGREKIDTVRGPMDTVVIQPVIKREGKVEDKGDLKMWMTDDARRIPVRIYAKFKKIKMWTLFAELVPPKEGG